MIFLWIFLAASKHPKMLLDYRLVRRTAAAEMRLLGSIYREEGRKEGFRGFDALLDQYDRSRTSLLPDKRSIQDNYTFIEDGFNDDSLPIIVGSKGDAAYAVYSSGIMAWRSESSVAEIFEKMRISKKLKDETERRGLKDGF